MQIRQIPQVAVRIGFRTARLPLTVAETVFRRDDEWLPTHAYETVEARFKQVVGRAVRDHELVEEGILEQAKTVQLGKAAALESSAEHEKELADASFEERRKADEEEREQVAEEATERKRAAERERVEEKQKADAAAAEKARAVQKAQAATEKTVAKRASGSELQGEGRARGGPRGASSRRGRERGTKDREEARRRQGGASQLAVAQATGGVTRPGPLTE